MEIVNIIQRGRSYLAKKIIIESCGECSEIIKIYGGFECNVELKIVDSTTIPDWCPLDDN